MTQGNETRVSSFDEWLRNPNRKKLSDVTYKEVFEAGAASRQDEVSKLQAGIDKLKSLIAKQQIQMLQIQQSCSGCDSRDLLIDELQKQIEDALNHAINHGGYDDLTHIINTLKGEETK